jgi:hypothetical protein
MHTHSVCAHTHMHTRAHTHMHMHTHAHRGHGSIGPSPGPGNQPTEPTPCTTDRTRATHPTFARSLLWPHVDRSCRPRHCALTNHPTPCAVVPNPPNVHYSAILQFESTILLQCSAIFTVVLNHFTTMLNLFVILQSFCYSDSIILLKCSVILWFLQSVCYNT